MKKSLVFTLTLLSFVSVKIKTFAQSEELRNKIQMVVSYGGKNITADLNSLGTSISRPSDQDTVQATDKLPLVLGTTFYLTLDIKQVDIELLKVFSKKQNRFDGTITITDTYGKNPPRVIKFKQGGLYNYSDQFSAASYGDPYGNTSISIFCKEISINGVIMEQ